VLDRSLKGLRRVILAMRRADVVQVRTIDALCSSLVYNVRPLVLERYRRQGLDTLLVLHT
jgi:hypothetical protein